MMATILPLTIMLTKYRRAAVSMMVKGCIAALVLLEMFLIFTT